MILAAVLLLIAPLKVSMERFWRMVWENKIPTIVMLTKCTEAGKVYFMSTECNHILLHAHAYFGHCMHR